MNASAAYYDSFGFIWSIEILRPLFCRDRLCESELSIANARRCGRVARFNEGFKLSKRRYCAGRDSHQAQPRVGQRFGLSGIGPLSIRSQMGSVIQFNDRHNG
jgi:hypothetical protein